MSILGGMNFPKVSAKGEEEKIKGGIIFMKQSKLAVKVNAK